MNANSDNSSDASSDLTNVQTWQVIAICQRAESLMKAEKYEDAIHIFDNALAWISTDGNWLNIRHEILLDRHA